MVAASRSALLPAVFVLLWCTGYLVVRIAIPDTGPVRFLGLRFGSAAVLLAVAAFALRAPWPTFDEGPMRWSELTVLCARDELLNAPTTRLPSPRLIEVFSFGGQRFSAYRS